jgi:hypothetical protein
MIIIAHNGIDDGHPNETYSPNIGMPPAPPAPTQAVQASSITQTKDNNNALFFIPLIAVLVLAIVVAAFIYRMKKPKEN